MHFRRLCCRCSDKKTKTRPRRQHSALRGQTPVQKPPSKRAPLRGGKGGEKRQVFFKVSRMPTIKIEQQFAQIGVNSTKAQLKIKNRRLQMKSSSETPEPKIESKMPVFKINNKKINSESGLKSTMELTMDARNDGIDGAFKGINRIVEDGNFLGEMRNPGDRVGMLAKKRTSERLNSKEFNVGLMPKSSPEVAWERGEMRVSWSKHKLVIDWDGDYMPEFTLEPPHSVEVYLSDKPYIRILVEEGDPPVTDPGSNVDDVA